MDKKILIIGLISLSAGCVSSNSLPNWDYLSPFAEPINSEKEIKTFNKAEHKLQ